MPSLQKGSLKPLGKDLFRARYRDADGRSQSKTLRMNRTSAQRWLDAQIDEVDAVRRGDKPAEERKDAPTFSVLVDEFLAQHVAGKSTIDTLAGRLKRPLEKWGTTRIDRFSISELRAWSKSLPEGYAPSIVRSMRQALNYAVECGYIDTNPAKSIKLAKPKRTEKAIFNSFDDARKLGECLPLRFRAVPTLGVSIAVRPEELFALMREDIDREAGVIHIRRTLVDGKLSDKMKTPGSLRDVPLTAPALEALSLVFARVDTPLLFATKSGRPVNLDNFRNRDWRPAIIEAGLDPEITPYSMRHSAFSWWISEGLDLKSVATIGGTSLKMLDTHYAHAVPGYLDRARTIIEAAAAR